MRLLLPCLLITAMVVHAEEKKPMNVQADFDKLAADWQRYCEANINSGDINVFLKAPAYKALVALGKPAIPHIMKVYEQDELRPWEFVLEEISGVKFITDRGMIVWGEVIPKRLEWWKKEQAAAK